MSTPRKRGWKEEFSNLFENPSREGLRDLLKVHAGEFNGYDFKGNWPGFPKVARHVLAFANSGGGCLIVGVEERDDKTFEPTGIAEFIDKVVVQNSVQKFIPAQLKFEILDFSYEESEYPKLVGKKFEVALVEDLPEYIPFVAKSDGDGVRENAIYTRRGTASQEANYEEIQAMLNRRLETAHSSGNEFQIGKHLAELRSLYESIPEYISPLTALSTLGGLGMGLKNPDYPSESFERFVSRLINTKKKTIESLALRT